MRLTISSVDGNAQRLDGGAMFGNAPRPVWEKWIAPDERGRIPLATRGFLVETDDARILIETGIGASLEPKLADRFGVQTPERHRLIESLEAFGVRESDIDFVVLSHLHFDHAGGLLPPYGDARGEELCFPNALYLVGKEAFERARHPHLRDRASFIAGLPEKLEASGRLRIVDGDRFDHPALGALRFRFSHGHTPGQMHTQVVGGKSSAIFCGDLIPGTAWVHLPITMGYDRYPERLIDEKASWYAEGEPEGWLFLFTHDPRYAASNVRKDEKGRYAPHAPVERLERHPL